MVLQIKTERNRAIMSDLQIIVAETIETICDKFCKFSGTGKDNECVYMATHDGKCPLDELVEKAGLK